MKASDFVHRYEDSWGNACYVVAEERGTDYYAECPRSIARQTGWQCVLGSLSRVIPYAYHYARRSDALRRARQLYDTEEAL